MNINFANNIKNLRTTKNLTQDELASILGVSNQSISKWERGECYPNVELLPQIASYFDVSLDDLFGINDSDKEQRVSEYLKMYDELRLRDRKTAFLEFKKAIKEFPNDYRILVRYMELFREECDNITPEQWMNKDFSDYEPVADEIASIYNRIQNNCTDDSIRIWSKHLMCEHLFFRYQCCGYDEKYRNKALDILSTMPALCDSREYLAMMDTDLSKFYEIRENAIEELLYLLQNSIITYCYYEDKFSAEYKINVIEHINALLKNFATDENNKNLIHIIYNYGHLGHLYYEIGNIEKAIENLKIASELAGEFDSNPNAEYCYRFFEKEGEFHNKNMSRRIYELISKYYTLSDEFKATKEVQDILTFLKSK